MADDCWNGKISNLTIARTAFPELYSALSGMRHKARCDRLRSLALLGLYALTAQASTSVRSTARASERRRGDAVLSGLAEGGRDEPASHPVRDKLGGKLLASLEGVAPMRFGEHRRL